MTSLRGLRWTSREEVCEVLDRFLDETTPGPDRELDHSTQTLRERTAGVLSSLGDERYLPRFRRLLASEYEAYETRTAALQMLVRLRQPVSRAELYRTLELKVSVERQDWPEDLVALLRLYPASDLDPIVWEEILEWSPDRRAEALSVLLQTVPDHRLTRKLYAHWLQFDRVLDQYAFWHYPKGRSVHWNAHIVGLTRGWPETEAIIGGYRYRPVSALHGNVGSGWDYSFREGWASLVPEIWHDAEEFLCAAQGQPERFADRVDPLDLPLPVLCHYLAPDEVLLRVEEAIREVGAKGSSAMASIHGRRFPTGARWSYCRSGRTPPSRRSS